VYVEGKKDLQWVHSALEPEKNFLEARRDDRVCICAHYGGMFLRNYGHQSETHAGSYALPEDQY
jgi:hypothetical protein